MGTRNRYQLSFNFEEEELDRCACHIREDLGITVPVAYVDALWLAELHGGAPIPCRTIATGDTVDEAIYLNTQTPEHLAGRIIIHELVHRLANGPRYEELNPVRTSAPRREWIEELARRVSGQ